MSLVQTPIMLLVQLYNFTTFVSIVSLIAFTSSTIFASIVNITTGIVPTKTAPQLRSHIIKTSTVFQDARKSVTMPMALVPGILNVGNIDVWVGDWEGRGFGG
ncbi:hypothetical protein HRS9139_05595 [Pyrenophora teres f. teres]|uniref:Uncharacterized protein n=1 Tax=Pyrenophora teres f. teres TaxID=97479 RepID=A0A6S6W174_9PLEO|nr:hypothetical protein HRS9139_05595 [Pyrenophora teres f. teres]CAE7033514.1 hypothetical protein PTTW11_05222 [Pyrenophora teres f. teres]